MDTAHQEREREGATGEVEEVCGTRTTKKNRGYDLADVRFFTERNADTDYKILLALYQHRALSAQQIQSTWFPELHINSIRNRLRALSHRRILTVNMKTGIATRPVNIYSLATFGLRIVVENILQVMEYAPQYNEQKEHYTVDDLKIRSQHNHHHELQDWVLSIVSKVPDLLHCEWRRFPFLQEGEENIYVKPDWLFLEVDTETKRLIKSDDSNNPLLYPYLYRKRIFENVTLKPILCVECDRGTMSRSELVEKWDGYRSLTNAYMPHAITIFYKPPRGGDMRHRLIRETLFHSFQLEVIRNQIHLFQGEPNITQAAVSQFIERNMEILSGELMTNEAKIVGYLNRYNESQDNKNVSLLDAEKTVERFRMPVIPDGIITQEVSKENNIQFLFYAVPGWVNPHIKILAMKEWIKEGHLSMFSSVQFILMYPDDGFLTDVRLIEEDIYYMSFQEIDSKGVWGVAHYEYRKNRQVKWLEVEL